MKNRQIESLFSLFNYTSNSQPNSNLIMTSPSDIGVRRNLGRNGSRYAPKAIINVLKKYSRHEFENQIDIVTVSSQIDEKIDFHNAQQQSALKITEEISKNKCRKILHIGGGHDHAYPLLKAIEASKNFKNILILNIDAHCDTRIDDNKHSGTPFRNFDDESLRPFHLIQIGIHNFSNSKTTLSPLNKGSYELMNFPQLKERTKSFTNPSLDFLANCPFEITEDTAIFFSLDCDAIAGAQMKAVSAVNPLGLPIEFIDELLLEVQAKFKSSIFFGIYEYNPVFDDLSQLGSKGLASLIYNFLNRK